MLCCVAPPVGVRDSQSTLFCVAPQVGVRDSQSTLFCVAPRDGWHMDQLDLGRRKQQSAMQKLHLFLKHAHAHYFENTHTLLTRLKHAATASDHLFALKVAFALFDPALYYDW